MTDNEWSEPRSGDGSSGSSEDFVRQEKRAAEGLMDDAKAAAADAGSQAKKLASEKAEEFQGAAASHLKNFADAVRTAGDELADKEPGPVSDLVRQAAEGLERFSGALGRKSSSEMIDTVRDFGRQNPVGFVAGSMLAGFALARFASSGSPQAGSASGRSDESSQDWASPYSNVDGDTGHTADTAGQNFGQAYGAPLQEAPGADMSSASEDRLTGTYPLKDGDPREESVDRIRETEI